jgi:ketosteroid isomerase-like protein
VLPTVSHPAVLELEDNAVGNIQVFSVSVRGTAVDADHAIVAVCSHVLQLSPEGPSSLLRELAEIRQGRVAPFVVAGHRAAARQVPDIALVHELGERVDVAGVERLVGASHDRYVFFSGHRGDLLAAEAVSNRSAIGWVPPEPTLYPILVKRANVSLWTTSAASEILPRVSKENVERLKEMYRAYSREDFDAAVTIAHPEIEFFRPGQGSIRGSDALREWMEPDALKAHSVEPLDFRINGNRVLVHQHHSARGAESGIPVEADSWVIYTFDETGRATHAVAFLVEAEAVEAAGLTQ